MVKVKTVPVSKVKTKAISGDKRPKSQKKPYINKLKPEFAPFPQLIPVKNAIKILTDHVSTKKKKKQRVKTVRIKSYRKYTDIE